MIKGVPSLELVTESPVLISSLETANVFPFSSCTKLFQAYSDGSARFFMSAKAMLSAEQADILRSLYAMSPILSVFFTEVRSPSTLHR